jgi:hypothetical protein
LCGFAGNGCEGDPQKLVDGNNPHEGEQYDPTIPVNLEIALSHGFSPVIDFVSKTPHQGKRFDINGGSDFNWSTRWEETG